MNLDYRIVPNFPKDGINFIDMDYVYRRQLNPICDDLLNNMLPCDGIIAIGARGWVTGSILAYHTKHPIFLARDESKGLKDWIYTEKFSNEYDGRKFGISTEITFCKNVVIVDDLIATGNTIKSMIDLLHKINVNVVQVLSTVKLKEFDIDFDIPTYYVKEISCTES